MEFANEMLAAVLFSSLYDGLKSLALFLLKK